MSENKKSKNISEGKGGNNKALIIIGSIIILLLIVVIVILLFNKNSEEAASGGSPQLSERRDVVVTEENAEQLAEELLTADIDSESDIPVSYTVTMKSQWHFKDGTSESDNAYVANNAANTTDVYFDVVRNDTKEIIYKSPILPVGADISDIKLDQDLDAGVYECTLIYYLIDEDQNVLTTVNMWVELTIDK